jgi:alpha-beta hydrolase superfamily lysophospholipase
VRIRRRHALAVAFCLVLIVALTAIDLPSIGAGGLLHPYKQVTTLAAPDGCFTADLNGDGVTLRAWTCPAKGARRGSVVYLHGIADNRGSAAGVLTRFRDRGFDAVAYDSRAHGDSGGSACTYGFYEKRDLHRAIDTLAPGPVVLIGTSLGAAVALQEAADDTRVIAVVAAEPFSDLRTVATERAPFLFGRSAVDKAFQIAEQQAQFKVDEVSPVRAAERIAVPVLLIHGAADVDTPPSHSQRIFEALKGPKRLLLLPGVTHNHSLGSADTWHAIDEWIDQAVR